MPATASARAEAAALSGARPPDRWLAAALAVTALHPLLIALDAARFDPVSAGMAVLAAICAARTIAAVPARGAADRWRWQALAVGCCLWSVQWLLNCVPEGSLVIDQAAAKLFAAARQAAFVVALFPIPAGGARRHLGWLDAAQGLIFVALLTPLAWPYALSPAMTAPHKAFLYLGHIAMAGLAAIGVATQPHPRARALSRVLLWTLVAYAAVRIGTREAIGLGMREDSAWLLLGDGVFLVYLWTMARVPQGTADDTEDAPRAVLQDRIVPLLVAIAIVSLAFIIALTMPAAGTVAGLLGVASLIVFAARAALGEEWYRTRQQSAIEHERARATTLVDLMHEIRSPLGIVGLNAELLQRSKTLGERDRTAVERIEGASARISKVLEDLLALERLEAGLMPARPTLFDAGAVVADVARLFAARAEQYGVALETRGVSTPVRLDEGMLHRVLVNLVDNALRFTPRGGRVVIGLASKAGQATLTVADTGTGMAPAARAALFRRFAPVGQPCNGAPGTGLGLSISLALVRSMGGLVRVSPAEQPGTAFELIFPVGGPERAVRPERLSPDALIPSQLTPRRRSPASLPD